MSWTASDSIVIVGAGIIGLDVALVLAEKGLAKYVTIVAEYMPGDTSPTYTSPWAGCNYSSISGADAKALRWDRLGYQHLCRLASTCSDAAFVKKTKSVELWTTSAPSDKIQDISGYLEDFAVIPSEKLPAGDQFGITFTTVTVHAPQHLLWIYGRLKAAGVTFVRQRLPSLEAAWSTRRNARIVFNCTGNGAATLAGVADPACYPTRGQVLLVRAPGVVTNKMRYGADGSITYIIPRPGTDSHVILGGYLQKGNGDHATYAHESASILERCRALSDELRALEAGPEVLAVVAGLRPSRTGGARVERESRPVDGGRVVVVHNYGAGGTGFQAGFGMATDAVASVQDLLPRVGTGSRL